MYIDNVPLISVIIPVYNTEEYLDNSLHSVLKQSFRNFELILIDDGSSDKSGLICDFYERKDARVKVFHTDNKGVSSARNLGLSRARGTYVMFVDSDDELPDSAISHMVKEIADFSVGGVLRKNNNQELVFKYNSDNYYHYDNKANFFDDSFPLPELLDGPCAKIYRTDIISNNGLRFNENLSYGEDKLFVYSYLLFAKTIRTISDIVYIQKRREGSLSSNIGDKKHLKQIINFLKCYVNVVKTYQEYYSCQSVRKMYHVDVVRRYVYRYLHILRATKMTPLSYKDIKFISSLLKKDKESTSRKDGRYICTCVLIGKKLPSLFLYMFIYILNNFR